MVRLTSTRAGRGFLSVEVAVLAENEVGAEHALAAEPLGETKGELVGVGRAEAVAEDRRRAAGDVDVEEAGDAGQVAVRVGGATVGEVPLEHAAEGFVLAHAGAGQEC